MTRRARQLLLATTLGVSALGLSGCVALTVAGIATNVLSSALGGGGGPPAEAAAPSEQIQQALSGIDDQVSPSCSARLADGRTEAASAFVAGGDGLVASPWGGTDWQFDGLDESPKPADLPLSATPNASPQVASKGESTDQRTGQRCGLRLTCLPGMSSPVSMMVCEGGDSDPAAGGLPDNKTRGLPEPGETARPELEGQQAARTR